MFILYAAFSIWQRYGLERIHLEQSPEFIETAPVNSDISWTQQQPTDLANAAQHVLLQNGPLSGELYANGRELENPDSTGNLSGFRNFRHSQFPERNVFLPAGLNFEHLLSGRAKDWDGSFAAGNFAPRKESSALRVYSESSAALFWAGANSRWGACSQMTFSLDQDSHVDLDFRTTFQTVPDRDYLAYMWASYLDRAKAPAMHFWGVSDFIQTASSCGYGTVGWVSLDGKPRSGWPDTNQGIVHFLGAPSLTFEEGVNNLNLCDFDSRAFLLPFFFGLVDGDGDLSTTQDDMVYIMMFDQAEPVRLVMWDFSKGTGHPVWDWQYVIRKPQAGQTYGYRARLVYKPYAGLEDVLAEYLQWTKSLGNPRHHLKIDIEPPESATLFPADSAGTYGDKAKVYFGINPAPGWHFDHWEGNVNYKKRRFTGIDMNGDEVVHAVCHREG